MDSPPRSPSVTTSELEYAPEGFSQFRALLDGEITLYHSDMLAHLEIAEKVDRQVRTIPPIVSDEEAKGIIDGWANSLKEPLFHFVCMHVTPELNWDRSRVTHDNPRLQYLLERTTKLRRPPLSPGTPPHDLSPFDRITQTRDDVSALQPQFGFFVGDASFLKEESGPARAQAEKKWIDEKVMGDVMEFLEKAGWKRG